METVNFKDLNIKQVVEQISTERFPNIKVDSFLSFDEKMNLIEITVQEAEEEDMINPILLEKYFDLNVVYMYSNIIFSEEDKADDSKLYDILASNGIIDAIMTTIPAAELLFLNDILDKYIQKREEYRNSMVSGLKQIINSLFERSETIVDFLNNTDKNKLDEIADLANKIQK